MGKTEEFVKYYTKAIVVHEWMFAMGVSIPHMISEDEVRAIENITLYQMYSEMYNYLEKLDKIEEAEEYHQKISDTWQYCISNSVNDKPGLISAYQNYLYMGIFKNAFGKREIALKYYNNYNPDVDLQNLRAFLNSLKDDDENYGDYDGGEDYGDHDGEYEDMKSKLWETYKEKVAKALDVVLANYIIMGDYLNALGKAEEAYEYYEKVDGICEEHGVHLDYSTSCTYLGSIGQFKNYNDKGIYLEQLGETEKANRYYKKALYAREWIEKRGGLPKIYNDMGKMKEAGEYYQKIFSARVLTYDQNPTMMALRNLTLAYMDIGFYLNVLGKKEEASEYYKRAMDTQERIMEQIKERLNEHTNKDENGHYLGIYIIDLTQAYNIMWTLGKKEEACDCQKAIDTQRCIS